MATKYFALLTNIGAAKLANATALGEQVEITQMAVGDGNGVLPTPDPAQTALMHELRRAQLNMLTIDPVNTNQIIAEQVIPEDAGGWWIREIGLFDKDGDMIAVANCAETYKPQLQEGSGRVQVIRVILIVSSTESVTLKIDPSVVLATRQYVDDKVIEVRAYADSLMAAHLAANDPHSQYLSPDDVDAYIPAGLPLPWPQKTPPDGWLKCNGATFDKARYPKLAKAYPSGQLPDLRGEFIRGWDDGRGVDVKSSTASSSEERQLLSSQEGTLIGIASANTAGFMSALKTISPGTAQSHRGDPLLEDVPRVQVTQVTGSISANNLPVRESNTVISRPRNVAFNYIVRGA
ncbi:phage tail-collar fiber domain-containing protein [Scandinavium manionii]|uniref:phage tail-collar fiber domain-containing protein n=1 Tax=Scandinavium manionii TaxID=2926520 RepID=UPI00216636C8|nr:phage tail protein [Scandinavium manionii]MCS2168141.1 phage tail protein [Scandinavium manionii]